MARTQHKILLVEDDQALAFGYQNSLTKSGYQIVVARNLLEAKRVTAEDDFDTILLDLRLPDGNALDWIPEIKKVHPDLPIIVLTGSSDVPTAVKAMKSGAENFLIKPVEIDNLELTLRTSLELVDLRRFNRIKHRIDKVITPYFGTSPAATSLLKSLSVTTDSEAVVLLLGETGTGKGVVARWIHEHGANIKEAFVELNCSGLKGDLLRSELFGHTKGSFTSAVGDREGLVEMADGGTLFLDEIGDMDLAVQAQLLKTIEEKTFRRVGENRMRKSNFRLICATNKDLLKETDAGTFRKDLYYRICVFPITIPPLRDRLGDIEGLIDVFLREFGKPASTVSPTVSAMLRSYSWPGNIRELRNTLERAVMLAQDRPLDAECFPGLFAAPITVTENLVGPVGLQSIERDYLHKIIDSCKGDKKKASEILGISLATMYRKLGPATASNPHTTASTSP